MQSVSDLILSIYNEARNTSTNDFVSNTFGRIQKYLTFDSSGIISLGLAPTGAMLIKGVFAYKFSPEEKYRIRVEMGLSEKHVQGRGIVGADPHLERCFRTKNRAHFIDARTVPDPRLVEYAVKTGATHVLTMVADDVGSKGFSALSLWRSGAHDHYGEADKRMADVILPHVFMALNINKQLANAGILFDDTHFPPIICSTSGLINYIEDGVFIYLQGQFQNWTPLYLPQIILDGMSADSSRIYIAKEFTAKGRLVNNTLLVYISRKSSSGNLTKNEFKIAKLLAQDETYKQIAARLGTSPATVRNQAHNIYKKLGITRKSSIRPALLLQDG